MLRRLRIAASVFFAVVCVAFVVLWVRSYQNGTVFPSSFKIIGNHYGFVGYRSGRVGLATFDIQNHGTHTPDTFTTQSGFDDFFSGNSFKFDFTAFQYAVSLPFWFVITAAGLTAGLPWCPFSRRFSLRTLLIATMLIATMFFATMLFATMLFAVVLGLGVALSR